MGSVPRPRQTKVPKIGTCCSLLDVQLKWVAVRLVGPVSDKCDWVGFLVLPCQDANFPVWWHFKAAISALHHRWHRPDMTSINCSFFEKKACVT